MERLEPFTLGINYWPCRSAMSMWQRLDLGEVREDAARLRGLGFDLVRFFLMWEAFQPTADRVDADALRSLVAVVEAFGNAGLRVMPTLFTGHMSGVNWLPEWTLDRATPHGRFRTIANGHESPYGIGDFYADEHLLAAQERFARAVGEALRAHPALYVWDLGNEFSNLREPRSPHDAANWSERLTHALHDASGVGATGGIHGEDFERDRGIRPSSIAAPWEIATMHGYSVYSAWSRGKLDPDVVPFLAELARSFTHKPLLFSEFGNPACPPGETSIGTMACLNEGEMADYATGVLDRLWRGGAIGAMWWCWTDYDLQLADRPPFDQAPHELRFGIVRADGSEKPVAQALARWRAEGRCTVPAAPPLLSEADYYAALPEGIVKEYADYCSAFAG
jgi:endo-1,4-beta-mannosidase